MARLGVPFEEARIINLIDRPDRRREMEPQIGTLRQFANRVRFYDAVRPTTAGDFPSLGARGCFQSHVDILRQACSEGIESLLVVEDDFDFRRDVPSAAVIERLAERDWDIFYGAHLLADVDRAAIAPIPPDRGVLTASFLGFRGCVLPKLVKFLEGLLDRPAGSPHYGPMHVDGAYSVFRLLHPEFQTVAAFPPLGRQRRSLSDITPSHMVLDRWSPTRKLAQLVRRTCNWLERL